MASTGQYAFTVPSKKLCVFCLTDNVSPIMDVVSIQSLRSFLDLDYRKVFSIKKNFLDVDDAKGDSGVDIRVTLCKACVDLRNKFSDLHEEMEAIQRKLSGCVQTVLEVMINAESNVIWSKRYKERITGMTQDSVTMEETMMEVLKKTIPNKFRMETMQKCALHLEKVQVRQRTTSGSGFTEPLELKPQGHFLGEEAAANGQSTNHVNGLEDQNSEDEEMRMDEDADAEELMMKYNSFPGKFQNREALDDQFGAADSAIEGSESPDDEMESMVDTDQKAAKVRKTRGGDKNCFNSKYECKICGKVVVSLKNFELHQRRHTGEKPFACPFCDNAFRDTSNLRSHTLRYHRHFLFAKFKLESMTDDDFKSAMDKVIQSIVQINDGAGSAHQSHKCYLCQKDYTQKYAIEDHIVQRHYDILSTTILQLQGEVHTYASDDIAQFMAQLQESGDTCTICGLCGQNFSSGLEVNSHMKVHVRVKVTRNDGQGRNSNVDASDSLIQLKMKCSHCSKYFEDLGSLKRHTDLHQGNCANAASREAVYNCEHCGRSFCSYYSQRSHVLSFHRYEAFARYLPAGTTSSEIEAVVKKITGKYLKLPNGLFQCSLCRKEITQFRKLTSHMLVTHFDEVAMKLKVAISKVRGGDCELPIQNEEEELPQLDYFDNGNYDMPLDEDFEEDEDTMNGDGGNPADNLEVLISCPDQE